jgi:hypothetical protein
MTVYAFLKQEANGDIVLDEGETVESPNWRPVDNNPRRLRLQWPCICQYRFIKKRKRPCCGYFIIDWKCRKHGTSIVPSACVDCVHD